MRKRSANVLGGITAILLGASMGACRQPSPAPVQSIPPVTVSVPVVRDVTVWDEYTGRLEAVDTVNVQPRVGGYIESAPFTEGALVKKGDLLFTIDARPYQAQLDNATGNMTQQEAKLQLARNELTRAENAAPGALSPEEIDTRRQNVRQAEGALDTAKADVEAARLNVEWCRVTAAIAGRVGRKVVTPGNLVTGGSGQPTLLTTITSVDPIYCYIDVDEAAVLRYKRLVREHRRVSAREGTVPCALALTNEQGFPHEGTIDFVDNRMDPNTGTLQVRGVFPNPDGFLTPGMFGRVRIAGQDLPNATLVTDAAIGTDQNNKYVLTVDANDTVEYRAVTVGPSVDGYRVITSGLQPRERVIVNGLMSVRPGMKVRPQEMPMPGGAAGGAVATGTAPASAPTSAPASGPATQTGGNGG